MMGVFEVFTTYNLKVFGLNKTKLDLGKQKKPNLVLFTSIYSISKFCYNKLGPGQDKHHLSGVIESALALLFRLFVIKNLSSKHCSCFHLCNVFLQLIRGEKRNKIRSFIKVGKLPLTHLFHMRLFCALRRRRGALITIHHRRIMVLMQKLFEW